MLSHALVFDDLFQCPHLQVADALWQPTLALTGVAGSLLVYKHSVERPATAFAYAEIFGGVDPIMFEQSFVNHYQYLQEVRSPLRIFTLRFFYNYAMVIYAFTLSRISPNDNLGNRSTLHILNCCCI